MEMKLNWTSRLKLDFVSVLITMMKRRKVEISHWTMNAPGMMSHRKHLHTQFEYLQVTTKKGFERVNKKSFLFKIQPFNKCVQLHNSMTLNPFFMMMNAVKK